ncbi:protein suex-1-like [Vespula maculifrons]|uniref:Protein suex-1-like n=1 Tax=Vespula maculifrons TaxID=7453 RepID=A0ABD2BZA6_VESMC
MLKIFAFTLILCVATTLTYSAVVTKPNEDVILVRSDRTADPQTYGHGHHRESEDGYNGGYHHGHYNGNQSGHYGGHHGGYDQNDPESIEEQEVSIVEAQTTQEPKEALPENDQEILIPIPTEEPIVPFIEAMTNIRVKAILAKEEDPNSGNRRRQGYSHLNNFFPSTSTHVGSSGSPPGVVIIIANDYSTGKDGVASSVATIYSRLPNR